MFVMGPCRRDRFRISPWQLANYGVADGLGPHRANALPEIPIRIPNQDLQILAREGPFITAKDKVFVSHCRRRRKESLISGPAAQT